MKSRPSSKSSNQASRSETARESETQTSRKESPSPCHTSISPCQTSQPLSPGKTSMELTTSVSPETNIFQSTAAHVGLWVPLLPSLTELISSETTPSLRWPSHHKSSSTAMLEEAVTEVTHSESMNTPTRMEFPKKLAKTTRLKTQPSSLVLPSKNAWIALDLPQQTMETQTQPALQSKTILNTSLISTEKSEEPRR